MPSAVILRKDVRLDVPSVAPPLAEALKSLVQDVRLVVRKARGIFQEHLTEERAKTIAGVLNGLGIDAAVLPQAELQRPPRVKWILGGRIENDAFHAVLNPLKGQEKLPWAKFDFVSIGIVATPQYEEFLTSSGFKSLPPIWQIDDQDAKNELRKKLASRALKKDAHQTSTIKARPRVEKKDLDALYRDQTKGYVELWSFDPLVRYRVARHEFNYEYLGARLKKSSLENFKLLVRDVFAKIPRVLYTKISKDYLLGAELHEIIFDHEDEYERYTRWFMHEACGADPKPGVLARGVGEQLLGPDVGAPVDDVETVD